MTVTAEVQARDFSYLDSLKLIQVRVGYGNLGLRGELGYENKHVCVQGRGYDHALSTHPPARLLFHLGGHYSTFRCDVALNDDVPAGASHADFLVFADGRQVGAAPYVQAGGPAHSMISAIAGAQLLELVVESSRWEYCHAVWLDPRLETHVGQPHVTALADCLGRAEISLPNPRPRARRCIATVLSPGFESLADDMLGSLYANGECHDALTVGFVLGESDACARVIAKYKGILVPCKPAARINPMSKAIVYSVARVIDAEQFLCLDADMLVLGSLLPLFATLEACPEGALLAVREGNGHGLQTLAHSLWQVYGGSERDQQEFLSAPEEAAYPLVVNDGLFAGTRAALVALDGVIRSLPHLSLWVDHRRDMWWRNQFAFNLALAKLRCGVELDSSYNVQLHAQDVQVTQSPGGMNATFRGRPVRVLHRSGVGRRKYTESMGQYARVADPLAGSGSGTGYEQFLKALRGWVGRHGTSALAWSFYGTSDAKGARVKDPDVFPLLAALHYLIRSNGCVRVLECGTARGVSAACLASAVAHRENPRVVSFDPFPQPEREELWAALPASMRDCIETRPVGSLEGMTEAIERNECYEAALLDSIHTEEHVWQEFQLAARLVCPSGLILIHDPRLVGGTVDAALQRIESEGYGVTRLWCAAGGVSEDDGLGLALIENRRKSNQ
jgi:predicted O-methyltransferase YrrM